VQALLLATAGYRITSTQAHMFEQETSRQLLLLLLLLLLSRCRVGVRMSCGQFSLR